MDRERKSELLCLAVFACVLISVGCAIAALMLPNLLLLTGVVASGGGAGMLLHKYGPHLRW